jgi:uncharacterized membrane protein
MGPIGGAVAGVWMRWVHILTVITVLGGLIYARLVESPALELLPLERRADVAGAINNRFRPWLRFALFALVLSGLYNLVTKVNLPPGYHLWFGVKMLFALHIITVSFLLSKPSVKQERRNRMMSGVVISGVIVVLISAYLRFLSNWMQS